jgi:hypothetical protein
VIRFVEIILLEHLKQRRGPLLAIIFIGPLISFILGYFGAFPAGQLSSADWVAIAWRTWAVVLCPLFMSFCFGSIASVEIEDRRWDFVYLGVDMPRAWYLAKFALGVVYFFCCNLLLTISSAIVLFVVDNSNIGLVEILIHSISFFIAGLWLMSTLWAASLLLRSVALHCFSVAATFGFANAKLLDTLQISPWGLLPFLRSDSYLAGALVSVFATIFMLGIGLLFFEKFPPGRGRK